MSQNEKHISACILNLEGEERNISITPNYLELANDIFYPGKFDFIFIRSPRSKYSPGV